MEVKMQSRTRCAVSGSEDIESLYSFERFPLFMGCTTQNSEFDLYAKMDWGISKSSGLIQLRQLLPLDLLYSESHGAGCVGKAWAEHHQEFANFIGSYAPASVFEIGGGHGRLAKNCQKSWSVDWTILEPNPTVEESTNLKVIRGFFDPSLAIPKTEAIVHSHVFEHIYEPRSFMRHLSLSTREGSLLLFSVPNIKACMERLYTNAINFEHTVMLTEPYVEYLLKSFGFEVLEKFFFREDHSIFYAARRTKALGHSNFPSGLYVTNKEIFRNYVSFHLDLIKKMNLDIQKYKQVYLFGAHVFSQYLLAFGLDTSRITCLLDNDSNKQGKRLYGTNLQVQSPQRLAMDSHPVVILRAGVYNEEIKADILHNINNATIFLE